MPEEDQGMVESPGVKTLFIEPSGPWENGYIDSFNGKLRGELLNLELQATSSAAKMIVTPTL